MDALTFNNIPARLLSPLRPRFQLQLVPSEPEWQELLAFRQDVEVASAIL
jgi:hypothetical protein